MHARANVPASRKQQQRPQRSMRSGQLVWPVKNRMNRLRVVPIATDDDLATVGPGPQRLLAPEHPVREVIGGDDLDATAFRILTRADAAVGGIEIPAKVSAKVSGAVRQDRAFTASEKATGPFAINLASVTRFVRASIWATGKNPHWTVDIRFDFIPQSKGILNP
jgi:hypothetical protein